MTAFVKYSLPLRTNIPVPTVAARRRARCPTHATAAAPTPRTPVENATIPLASPSPLDKTGLPVAPLHTPEVVLDAFAAFFSAMPGTWNSERTYHYPGAMAGERAREESQTTFDVSGLSAANVDMVVSLAASPAAQTAVLPWQGTNTHGFRVSFNTRMGADGRCVRAATNLAFVPHEVCANGVVRGAYYRDVGYEEGGAVESRFAFDSNRATLTMTTFYSKVVSVDQISLINPCLRLRNIVNYARPPEGDVLDQVVLVGFGVEKRGEPSRLVK